MLADLHAHYPMRVVADLTPRSTLDYMRSVKDQRGMRNKLRALLIRLASRHFSHASPEDDYRVTVEGMRKGGVGLAMSVLYRPGEEILAHYSSPPRAGYFGKLLEDLDDVEAEVAGDNDRAVIRVVHDRAELERCLDDKAIALVHAVEGGFHLGEDPADIRANVRTLASKGVAYITVAHLFFREVANNAPALPFLKRDGVYNLLFPQLRSEGLTDRGIAAVRAMVEHRVMIDISHMRQDAIDETFELLDDELDPNRERPVIASHAGFRCGHQKYMLDEPTILKIKERDGVIGLILAQYQLNDGLRRKHTESFEEGFKVIRRHIDKIAGITGGHRHIALGTDFDGFIKPTMSGLERMGDLGLLERRLREAYGDEEGELMTSGNALRVLRKLWPASPA